MSAGRLITIEGIDGVGKTTLAEGLERELRSRGVAIRLLREPGGVRAAERIRELVKDPELQLGAAAEALLYAAARAQLVEEAVRPLLHAGTWVLLDRFLDSSLAYQGAGRGLGVDAVRAINRFAIQGLHPDRTLLLRLHPSHARTRTRTRTQPADRMEREQREFFARTQAAYDELARQDPGRIRVLDAARPPQELLAAALDAVGDLL
jgi:dTMP kinase